MSDAAMGTRGRRFWFCRRRRRIGAGGGAYAPRETFLPGVRRGSTAARERAPTAAYSGATRIAGDACLPRAPEVDSRNFIRPEHTAIDLFDSMCNAGRHAPAASTRSRG